MRISDWSSDVCSSDLDRFVRAHPRIGAAQAFDDHAPQRAAAVGLQRRRRLREQHRQQAEPLQPEEALLRVAGQEQLQALLEQPGRRRVRSEEHTSELQSLMRISYAVFCLKKKKTNINYTTQQISKIPTNDIN